MEAFLSSVLAMISAPPPPPPPPPTVVGQISELITSLLFHLIYMCSYICYQTVTGIVGGFVFIVYNAFWLVAGSCMTTVDWTNGMIKAYAEFAQARNSDSFSNQTLQLLCWCILSLVVLLITGTFGTALEIFLEIVVASLEKPTVPPQPAPQYYPAPAPSLEEVNTEQPHHYHEHHHHVLLEIRQAPQHPVPHRSTYTIS